MCSDGYFLNANFSEDVDYVHVLDLYFATVTSLSTYGWWNLNVFESAGFNVETVEYKNISFTVWDVGGQDKVSKAPEGQ